MNHTTKRIISQFRVLNMNLLRVMNECRYLLAPLWRNSRSICDCICGVAPLRNDSWMISSYVEPSGMLNKTVYL